ncbi:L-threonylcarbamoyladenylate synthase [Brevibacillus daliensis]|uniref:L-threonylcarbamoyladenylate synthase n=1 Tax=Brevibacillus daliensis TaxID=2892995 RepID=UPI001E58E263|nr:L-threonylcarbamoyladenylate synthase [Brevibacillus daliensis]
MQTKVWVVDKNVEENKSCSQLVDAASLIRSGEVVAFPTETVYGLGANALSDTAVEKIFKAKGRPSDNPLIVHIGEASQLDDIVSDVPPKAKQLIDAFWPGPLTMFLPKKAGIAARVTAGLSTVGVRMPDHPIALALIKEAGVPIAAPSANRSGRPSPTTREHVQLDLDGRIAGIVDGGSTGVGVESTTIDMTTEPPMIHRPGGITYEQIREVIGDVAIDPAFLGEKEQQPISPGMKYKHYAPEGELWLVEGKQAQEKMQSLLQEAKQKGLTTGVMVPIEQVDAWKDSALVDLIVPCGSIYSLEDVAHDLYTALRRFDESGVQFILAETFPRKGLGMAIMNRLEKAASHRIIST